MVSIYRNKYLKKCICLLIVIYVVYTISMEFIISKSDPQPQTISEQQIVKFNYKPCEHAITTAMCRGRTTAHTFKRQLSQTTTLVKSILIRERYYSEVKETCTDVLIISDTKESYIQLLKELKAQGYAEDQFPSVRLVFVQSTYPPGCENFDHLYGPCASIRLFLDKLLPNYDSVLYVDNDTLFLKNIEDLWQEFQTFTSGVWAAFGPDEYDMMRPYPFYGSRGLNSGVAFMNLTRMRDSNFFSKIQVIRKMLAGSNLPDQDFLNFYFRQNPAEVTYLDCSKNYMVIFCTVEHLCATNEISILHGAGRVFRLPSVELLLRAIYRIFVNTRLDENITQFAFRNKLYGHINKLKEMSFNNSICLANVENFIGLLLKSLE